MLTRTLMDFQNIEKNIKKNNFKPNFVQKKFSHAVMLCPHCTGQLLTSSRGEEKAYTFTYPSFHWKMALPHVQVVDCSWSIEPALGLMTSRTVHNSRPLEHGLVLGGSEVYVSISPFSSSLDKEEQLTRAVREKPNCVGKIFYAWSWKGGIKGLVYYNTVGC